MSSEYTEEKLLEQRAALLAQKRQHTASQEEFITMLEFRDLDTHYAVELEKVEAVGRIGEIFPIPLTPKHILGIVRRRGQSRALVSLRRYFSPQAAGLADADFAVYARAGGKRFALAVDEILGVAQLPLSEKREVMDNIDPRVAPFLSGVSFDGVLLIDLDSLVDTEGFGTRRRN